MEPPSMFLVTYLNYFTRKLFVSVIIYNERFFLFSEIYLISNFIICNINFS